MKKKIFGLGIAVFYVLGIVFPSLVWSNGGDFTAYDPKVQVKMESIQLSSDGGATWGDDILGGASDWVEINPDDPAGSITNKYFKQNVQVTSGTYNKVKITLNSVVRISFYVDSGGTYYYTEETTTPFDQATGQYCPEASHFTTEASRGWWYMTLNSGREVIEKEFLDANGSTTNLTIAEGQTSTIRVEVLNDYGTLYSLGSNYYSCTDYNPSDSTRIYVQ